MAAMMLLLKKLLMAVCIVKNLLAFYNNFCSVPKKEIEAPIGPLQLKKKKKSILNIHLLVQIFCDLVDSYKAKMMCFGEGTMELCMCENAIFFLPVNVHVWLSWPHNTLPGVLIWKQL